MYNVLFFVYARRTFYDSTLVCALVCVGGGEDQGSLGRCNAIGYQVTIRAEYAFPPTPPLRPVSGRGRGVKIQGNQ